MGRLFADFVEQSSTTVGLANYVLGAVPAGCVSFSTPFGVGEEISYVATDGVSFECGRGQLDVSGHLVRTNVFNSSSGGAPINWAAGTRRIYCAPSRWTTELLAHLRTDSTGELLHHNANGAVANFGAGVLLRGGSQNQSTTLVAAEGIWVGQVTGAETVVLDFDGRGSRSFDFLASGLVTVEAIASAFNSTNGDFKSWAVRFFATGSSSSSTVGGFSATVLGASAGAANWALATANSLGDVSLTFTAGAGNVAGVTCSVAFRAAMAGAPGVLGSGGGGG